MIAPALLPPHRREIFHAASPVADSQFRRDSCQLRVRRPQFQTPDQRRRQQMRVYPANTAPAQASALHECNDVVVRHDWCLVHLRVILHRRRCRERREPHCGRRSCRRQACPGRRDPTRGRNPRGRVLRPARSFRQRPHAHRRTRRQAGDGACEGQRVLTPSIDTALLMDLFTRGVLDMRDRGFVGCARFGAGSHRRRATACA